MNCKNCNKEINSKFCPDCGQPASLKRIDGHYIIHEIEHVLHFERGILYTIKELITKPGQSTRKYIKEDRGRLVKPVIFIIVSSLIYSLVEHFFHLKFTYMHFEAENNHSLTQIFKWMQEHYGYANIIIGAFIAFWLKILFKKYKYNYFEILVMLCYVIGMQMLVYTLFAIGEGVTNFQLMKLAGISGVIYLIWVVGNFFGRKPVNYFKATISMILGNITTFSIALLLGLIIDKIMH